MLYVSSSSAGEPSAYEDLKGEMDLDHFEGRRFRGWHHHVSVALACFAFVVTERPRVFPAQEEVPVQSEMRWAICPNPPVLPTDSVEGRKIDCAVGLS